MLHISSLTKNPVADDTRVSTVTTATVDVTSAACPAARRWNSYDYDQSHRVANVPEFEIRAEAEYVEKRTDVLASLAGFAAAKISDGCSCLGLKPAVMTTTTTTTSTAAAPVYFLPHASIHPHTNLA